MSSTIQPSSEAHREFYKAGEAMRRKVMGDEYVDGQLEKNSSEFMKSMQELATEAAWGTIWTRPGLELKQRSLINIALLASHGKDVELAAHIRGAINNGATVVEIKETLLQTAVYTGIPVGIASFRVAEAALAQLEQEGKI